METSDIFLNRFKGAKSLKFKLRQLEAFRSVAETGSITKAAKQLGVSQPAVSRLVSDFSGSIGFEFFKRRRGILEPTSDSRYLLAEKETITPSDLVEERLIHTRRDSRFFKTQPAPLVRMALKPTAL